jgi:heptosyltransferase-3
VTQAKQLCQELPMECRRLGRERSIGIVLTEHLGDIVACEPIGRYLRERHPDALICWVVNERYVDVVRAMPAVDRVVSIGCLVEAQQLLLGVFDETYCLHFDGRCCEHCQASLRSPQADTRINLENYFDFGSLLPVMCRIGGLPALNIAPTFQVASAARSEIATMGLAERYCVFHTLSNESCKDWTTGNWAALANRLVTEQGLSVVEVGTASAFAGPQPGLLRLSGKLSIMQTAAVIEGAQLFVGIDSGPAHIANALEVPGVVLMGRYRKFTQHVPYTGGYADGSTGDILRAAEGDQPARELTVDVVYSAAARRLGLHKAMKLFSESEAGSELGNSQ